MDKKLIPQEHEEEANEKQKKQELEVLKKHQEQVLTLQRMKEIEKEIELAEEKELQDIIKVDGVQLSDKVKLQKAYLAEIGEQDDMEYLLYTDQELIGRSNEMGMIELNPEYVEERNQQLAIYEERFGENYLIETDQELDPLAIQENSEELVRQSELEKDTELETECKDPQEREEEERQNEETVHNMEDDLGVNIISLVRIEDANFSKDVIGRQTGYKEQYVGLTDSGTFHLIGENSNGKYELNPDFLGATTASTDEQPEYDENGNCCGNSYTDLVMRRADGTRSNLAIDLNYGQICLYNRETHEEIRTSTCKPTEQEVEEAKEADEKGRTIAEQEKYVEQLAEKVNKGEESVETLEVEREKLEEQKEEEKDEEDPYYESWVEDQHRKGYM